MKILHLGTYGDEDGVSEYLKDYIGQLDKFGNESEVFKVDFSKHDSIDNANAYYEKFIEKSEDYDLIHIQHQWGMFTGEYSVINNFTIFKNILKGLYGKKVFVTFHSPPPFPFNHSIFNKVFRIYFNEFFTENGSMKALVHNSYTENQFIKSGFHQNSVKKIFHPVFEYPTHPINDEIKEKIEEQLKIKSDTVVVSMLGFIRKGRGHEDVLKALKILPSNYKFIILGGVSPRKTKFINNEKYYIELKKKIKKHSLEERVLITGIWDKKDLDTYFNLIDIFLLPYSPIFKDSSGAANLVLLSNSPVITYDLPSFIEMNKKHEVLCLVEQGNIQELKEKIIRLNEDSKLRNYYKNEIKKYIEDNSSFNQTKKILKIFEDCFGN